MPKCKHPLRRRHRFQSQNKYWLAWCSVCGSLRDKGSKWIHPDSYKGHMVCVPRRKVGCKEIPELSLVG